MKTAEKLSEPASTNSAQPQGPHTGGHFFMPPRTSHKSPERRTQTAASGRASGSGERGSGAERNAERERPLPLYGLYPPAAGQSL